MGFEGDCWSPQHGGLVEAISNRLDGQNVVRVSSLSPALEVLSASERGYEGGVSSSHRLHGRLWSWSWFKTTRAHRCRHRAEFQSRLEMRDR